MTHPAPLTLEPLPFETPVTELGRPVLIEYEDGTVAVAEVLRSGATNLIRATVSTRRHPRHLKIPDTQTLSDVAAKAVEMKPVRAFLIPDGQEMHMTINVAWELARVLVASVALAGALFGAVLLPGPWPILLGIALVGLVVLSFTWHPRDTRPWTHTLRTAAGGYRLESILDQRPAVGEASAHVDEVKEEYGRLLSDIIYRIECPALFDAAVGPTRAFTAALLQWDSAGSSLTPAERSELAAKVRVTFDAARANAEAIGINHIPEESRESARRAAKALRLAASTRNEQERAAAQQQAVRILNSLALYYLPDPDETTTMLEGRRVLALPGRRTTQEKQ